MTMPGMYFSSGGGSRKGAGKPGPRGPQGDPGERGERGPAGPPGPPGQDAVAAGGTRWKGKWERSEIYVPGDLVTFQGATYVCTSTISGIVPTTKKWWDVVAGHIARAQSSDYGGGGGGTQGPPGSPGASIVWRGAYNVAVTYHSLDAVSFNGSSYICTATTVGNDPTNAQFWDLMAQQGAQGATGAGGAAGPAGPAGASGSTWYNGTGAPAAGTGIVNDYYLDDATGNVYQKQGGGWTVIGNLMGPTGATGATGAAGTNGTNGANGTAGANGATWYNGTGAPAAGTGVLNDYYLNTTTDDIFQKQAGGWTTIGNIKGATGANGAAGTAGTNGATWYNGTGAPASGTGVLNDYYLNTSTGDVYQKQGGGWTTIGNIKGATGTTGATGATGTSFTWKGTFLITTAYAVNDVVEYNGSAWICKTANTGSTPNPASPSVWQQMVQGFNITGAWSSSTTYSPGDVVYYNGASYVCTAGNSAVSPTTTAFWTLVCKAMSPLRNRIINGSFDFWQRNTAFSGINSARYTADRWAVLTGTGGVVSLTKTAISPGQLTTEAKLNNSALYQVTTASTSGYIGLEQRIESVWSLQNQQITVSLYVYGSSGTPSVQVQATQSFGTGGSPSADVTTVIGTFTPVASTWSRFTFTATLPSISGKTLGTNNNDSLKIQLVMPNSATYGFYITGVQVEPGGTTSEFEYRPYALELAMCHRYYLKSYDTDVNPATITASGEIRWYAVATAGEAGPTIRYPQAMRQAPTLLFYSPTTGAGVSAADLSASSDVTFSGTNASGPTGHSGGPGLTAGHVYAYHFTADAEI